MRPSMIGGPARLSTNPLPPAPLFNPFVLPRARNDSHPSPPLSCPLQILADIAQYSRPSEQSVGLYRLKQEAWREFDPFHFHYTRHAVLRTLRYAALCGLRHGGAAMSPGTVACLSRVPWKGLRAIRAVLNQLNLPRVVPRPPFLFQARAAGGAARGARVRRLAAAPAAGAAVAPRALLPGRPQPHAGAAVPLHVSRQ